MPTSTAISDAPLPCFLRASTSCPLARAVAALAVYLPSPLCAFGGPYDDLERLSLRRSGEAQRGPPGVCSEANHVSQNIRAGPLFDEARRFIMG